jgi:hypothetical protein
MKGAATESQVLDAGAALFTVRKAKSRNLLKASRK